MGRRLAGAVWLGLLALAGTLAVWSAGLAWERRLGSPGEPDRRPLVVASTTIIADLARQVGGERVRVYSLLGPGQDPHTYEPTPLDALSVARASLVLLNGYYLDYWAERLVPGAAGSERPRGVPAPSEVSGTPERPELRAPSEAGAAGRRLVRLAEEVRTQVLPWPGDPLRVDPHLWMDPTLAAQYAEHIYRAFVQLDPAGEELFRRNARRLTERLHQLDGWIAGQVATIPPQRRKLVTTHDAYRYFGRRYGLEVLDTIWGVSTEEEPSAHRLAGLFRNLRRYGVPAFVETTINPQTMQEIAAQAGVRIGGKLYADALGPSGSGAETYVGMMEHNVRTIVRALGGVDG